jgi:hypothetical protein
MQKKFILISVLIIAAILVAVYYFMLAPKITPEKITPEENPPTIENYTTYVEYMTGSVQDKVYPEYKYYDIEINPPNVTTGYIEDMSADESGYCPSCFTRAFFIKSVRIYWYNYKANSYAQALEEAAKYKIEFNPNPRTENVNPFYYYITFGNAIGTIDDIKINFNPSEATINKMSFDELKSFNHMTESINLSSTYPSLSGKNEYCFSFFPWQISHSFYNIKVPTGMISYNVTDDYKKCNIAVSSVGNIIKAETECKLYTLDMCTEKWVGSDPTHPFKGITTEQFFSGDYTNCTYPKVEICFN